MINLFFKFVELLKDRAQWKRASVANMLSVILLVPVLVLTLDRAEAIGQETNNQQENQAEDKPSTEKTAKAWEFSPYQVLVWICHDQSSYFNRNSDSICSTVQRDLELLDRSGWRLTVKVAPAPWNWRLLNSENLSDVTQGLLDIPEMETFDKLICVRVRSIDGRYQLDAQEMDVQTQQWGARNVDEIGNWQNLANSVTRATQTAFMPLARIDKVYDRTTDEGTKTIVKLRVRGAGLINTMVEDEEGNYVFEPNVGSPIWVADNNVFLPVIRRLDRAGALEAVNLVQWTFLTILEHHDTMIECEIHSKDRAPLSGRVGRRSQRFALVIRPPNRPSRMLLTTKDKENPKPIQGIEIYSRLPGWTKDQDSEFLGTTDWRGTIDISPNKDGEPLRVLYAKSGNRALARLPIVPGLFDHISAKMPNDDKRLYAQGVAQGLTNELMDLVARRQVIAAQIVTNLERSDFAKAKNILNRLRRVQDANDFAAKLANERTRLLSTDERENNRINAMFDSLEKLARMHLPSNIEAALGEKIAVAQNGGDWESIELNPLDPKIADDDETEEDTVPVNQSSGDSSSTQ